MPCLTSELKLSRPLPSELYTLLLEDILVLLQKQDERLILKCHSKNLGSPADTKHIFSPIIKLNTVLVRSVATGQSAPHGFSLHSQTLAIHLERPFSLSFLPPPFLPPDNKSFFVLSTSENGPQIYELMAPTVSDQMT